MSASTVTIACLECDHDGCRESYVLDTDSSIRTTRGFARGVGWHCDAKANSDLCPEHAPKEPAPGEVP